MSKDSFWLMFSLMMLVFCIPAFARVLLDQDSILYLIKAIILCVPLVYALLCLRNRILFCILFFCLMMLSGTEMYFVVAEKSMIQTENVRSIFATTDSETTHFFSNNVLKMASTLPQLFLGIVTLIIGCFRVNDKPSYSLKKSVVMGIFLACSLLYGAYSSIPPYNILKCCMIASYKSIEKHCMPLAEGMTFKAHKVKTDGEEYYVFCIGESLRADHLSLNGYVRDTTPKLRQLENLISFTNYYSTATLTLCSVPLMITRATVDDYNISYKEYSILKPFKECGFKTFVIVSNKNLLYSETHLTRSADQTLSVSNDSIVPIVIDSLTQRYPKAFFLVQLYQSHCYFANFAPRYNVYHPNIVSDRNIKSKDLLLNAYDNTVLNTDEVMSNIIHVIDKPKARSAFLFASDHGEVLDMEKPRRGVVLNPGSEEYHVGMMFWSSDKWNKVHRDAVQRIQSISHKPVNADCLFYTACDMADIKIDVKLQKPEWSLLSPKFKIHERKILLPDGFSKLRPDRMSDVSLTKPKSVRHVW